MLLVLILHVLLSDGLEPLHAEVLRLLHHGVRARVLVSPGELSGQEEVMLVKGFARV